MFNRERTKELLGYDLDLEKKRRSKAEHAATGGVKRNNLTVVDNCPECDIERQIKLRQSRANKPCSKCFHASDKMKEAKKNQSKTKSEVTKQRMRDNHWSKKGTDTWNKDKTGIYSEETLEKIRVAREKQFSQYTEEDIKEFNIQISCTQQGIKREDFDGFITPENTKIRQSPEGKAWRYDVMAKANFTCNRCDQRGGSLHAHHLNGFNSFPEQRIDVDNGICLCEDCHSDFHQKYGKGDNTKEQYNEYIQSR